MIETSPELYVYEREYRNKLATVICNVTDQPQLYPLSEEGENDYRRVILENEGVRIIKNHAKLSPYGAVVLLTDFEDTHE